jgi:hypothetical protein
MIQKVIVPTRDSSVISPFVVDINFLATKFVSVSFLHVTRSANEVAHLLAREGELIAYSIF